MFGLLGLVKGVAVVCSMAFALPVGGVYASADSPSKYLDRLTTVNSSASPEGGESSGVEDEPTVSRAVRTSHGVILNTVVRNANRLEYSMGNTDDSNVQTVADTTTDWTQWNTVGWSITDDGVLKIRPWEGNTGTTGATLYAGSVPWYNQASKIKKVESTGTIVLNASSTYLFYNCSNLTDLTGLASWNVSKVTDMSYMFYRCSSLTALTPLEHWDVSNVTNMNSMFQNCSSLTALTGLSGWNVSNVTDMGYMFSGCSSLTNLTPLERWNVSNVTGMSYMFSGCSSLTNLTPLERWNVSNVTGMSYMFRSCSSLTDLTPLALWNVSNVTDMYSMFAGCSKLTTLAGWDVSKVTNMSYMFSGCSSLTNLTPISGWDVSNVTNMSYMFYNCSSLTNLTGLAGWNVSNVTDMGRMFSGCSKLTDLTALASWNVSNVTDMYDMFAYCSNLTDLTGLARWNVSKVTNMREMFRQCSNLTDLTAIANWNVSNVTNMNYMFSGCSKLTDITTLGSWNVSNVTSMGYMFQNCSSLTSLTGLENWSVSKVTTMVYMFSGCSNLTDLTPIASWDVSNVTDMDSMFSGCSSLTNLTPISGWDVSNVTNMKGMLSGCSSLIDLTPLTHWNVSNVKYMNYMFNGCSKLTDLTALADWNVSNVTNMYGMFYKCSKLTDLTALADWNVSKVTDMSALFSGCSSLTDLTGLENWNVSKVTSMSQMFDGCLNLSDLSALVHWDTSNVTDMPLMFSGCSSLTDLTGLENWNVSKVTVMSSMFTGCSNLSNLSSLEDWNVSRVKNMYFMFSNCPNLTDINGLADWNVSNVTSMWNMFSRCPNLTDITALASWNVSNVTNMSEMFSRCSNLTDLTALANWNVSNVTNMKGMFNSCSNLQKVGIPSINNGGQNLVSRASQSYLGTYLTTIITEDFTLGPYSWSQLQSEMQTNPDAFQDGTVWVKYIPSWMVTYNANGGVSSMPGSMTPVNQLLTLPESSFLRFGYKFTGWTTQPDPVSDTNTLMKPGQIFNPSDKTDGKKYTLYAQWEKLGDTGDQPTTGQSGMLPGWIQVDSDNTKADITPNQSQNVTFTNKYDPGSTSIQFKFTKLMDGNVPDSSESFHFELVSASENKVIQTTMNTGAAVQFKPITYDKAGTYKYYVRETPLNVSTGTNSNPNLNYDDHLVEVVVTVTEEDDPTSPSGRKLKATAQITGDTTFRNDSKPASLDITKTVTGVTEGMNGNHKDREFTFNVNLLDRDNQPVTDKTYTITTTSDNGGSNGDTTPSTGSITFDSKGNATVKLKDGSKLTINGIPAYYKYVITETDIPAGYDNTSLTNPSGVLGANSHVIVDAVNQYTVTPASVSLQAGKTLLAPGGLNQSVNNGEFRFSLCQVTPAPIGLEAGPNVESCAGVSEASNDGNGLVTFPQLTFDTPGTYTYQIREVKGDTLDMTYDSTVYTATVNVTDDGEGRLVAKVTYRSNTTGVESSPVSSPVWDPSDPGSMGVPVFVNRTTVANRLPVTGGSDVIIASVILALILSGGLFVLLRRNREE